MIYTNEMIKEKNDKKIKLHKIFKIISFPIMIIILLIALYVGYTKFIKKGNDINILGFRFFMVVTGSMEPEYKIGDVIIVKETSKENIKVGDVINYLSENGKDTVTHRVTEMIQQDGKTLYRVTAFQNVTDVSANIANAYKDGKQTCDSLEEAKEEFTIDNGYFGYFGEYVRN